MKIPGRGITGYSYSGVQCQADIKFHTETAKHGIASRDYSTFSFFIDEEQAKNLLEVYHHEWNAT